MEYILFIGFGLYVLTSLMFLYLFLRTLKTKDGIGLVFLKTLTFAIFLGSVVIAISRYLTLFHGANSNIGRAIATINPITLLGVGLYLNYLFHKKYKKEDDSKNIAQTKSDVKVIKKDVKEIKEEVTK